MRKSILVALTLLLAAASTALADQYVVFACNYKEGKGPADLQKWFDTLAKPALDAAGAQAEVSVLTPTVSNDPETPDFYWVERWPDLAAYGKSAGLFFDPGAKFGNVVVEAFKIWTCQNAIYAGAVFYKGK
jgi:hypothetical protein